MSLKSIISVFCMFCAFGLVLVAGCSPGSENVVPELILDVPDQRKPDIAGIVLRIQADDIYPFEIDLAKNDRELIIPTGSKRTIHALVSGAGGQLIASGMTVCAISSVKPKIEITLAIPPAAPVLTAEPLTDGAVALCWSRYVPASDSVSFAAYRLYRSTVNEVSQISDLAALVSDAAETVFAESGMQDEAGYYRVYVYEKSGAFNGSAVVRAGSVNAPDSLAL